MCELKIIIICSLVCVLCVYLKKWEEKKGRGDGDGLVRVWGDKRKWGGNFKGSS